jgi:hypothetical protein
MGHGTFVYAYASRLIYWTLDRRFAGNGGEGGHCNVCASIKSGASFLTVVVYLNMRSLSSQFCRFWGVVLSTFFLGSSAQAQMQIGDQMKDYAQVFGVPVHVSPYSITLLEDKTSESSILAPGQQPALSFLVTNNTAQRITASGKVDVIHYGTRGITGDFWTP